MKLNSELSVLFFLLGYDFYITFARALYVGFGYIHRFIFRYLLLQNTGYA